MKYIVEYLDFSKPSGEFKQRGSSYYLIDNSIEFDILYPYEHPHYDGMLKLPIFNSTFKLDDLDNRELHEWAEGDGQDYIVGTATVYYPKSNKGKKDPIIDRIQSDEDITKDDITYLSVDTDELYDINAYKDD